MMKGHNELPMRLDMLASDIRQGWDAVEKGEAETVEGWLMIGMALNEARSLFPSNEQFGQWVSANLAETIHPHERAAAMWAAANADQLAEARAASKARTLRGWHDQWKKIEAEREEAARKIEQEAARKKAATEAEAKREAAADAARVEARAKAEADQAASEEERQQAETRAVEAAQAREQAEAEAQKAEKAAAPAPDPHAAERRKLAGLTREALEDDLIGLRAALEDERAKRRRAEEENRRLRDEVRDLSADDKNEVIRRLQREAKHNASERWRQQEETRRAMAQVHALKKRVAELEKMGIEL